MLELLIAVNRFIVFALCRCSERFCVPSVSTIWTFCGWQSVSSTHRSLFAVLGVPECIWEQGLWSSLFGWKQQQGFQNWRSRLNFSGLELILEAFCVSCWKYLQYRLEWGLWSRLCSPEWVQPWGEIPPEQHRVKYHASSVERCADWSACATRSVPLHGNHLKPQSCPKPSRQAQPHRAERYRE